MRITFNMQSNETLLTLNNQQEQINQLSQQIASGVKLSSASDDPDAWAQTMNVNQGLGEYNSIVGGLNFATGWGQSTESSLSQLSDLVSQAKQVAISASGASTSTQSSALVSQVNGILSQALNMANSQYGDQYIFAGTKTTTAPYSISSSGVVSYSGDSNSIEVKTGTCGASAGGSTVVNLTGDQVFDYTSSADGSSQNVLNAIWTLGHAIQTGDSATVSSSITTLSDAFNHISNESSVAGSMVSDISTQQSAISAIQLNAKTTLSNLDETNIASATTQLTQVQTAFQAALKVSTTLENLNLASYLSGTS